MARVALEGSNWLLLAFLGRWYPVQESAFADAGEVQAHGVAGGAGVLSADGLDDGLVLAKRLGGSAGLAQGFQTGFGDFFFDLGQKPRQEMGVQSCE